VLASRDIGVEDRAHEDTVDGFGLVCRYCIYVVVSESGNYGACGD
jgi:hypothetical protein